MKIHHIGYAVKSIDFSINEFKKLGYIEYNGIYHDNLRNVIIQFMKNDNYMIELICPMNDKSPIKGLLNKVGNSPYHICYEVNNIQQEINNLKKNGYLVIEKPIEAIAINNKKVSFLFNQNVGIIELVEK